MLVECCVTDLFAYLYMFLLSCCGGDNSISIDVILVYLIIIILIVLDRVNHDIIISYGFTVRILSESLCVASTRSYVFLP